MEKSMMISLCNSTFSMMVMNRDGDGGGAHAIFRDPSSSSSSSSALFVVLGTLAMGALVLVRKVSARSFASAFNPRNLLDFYSFRHHPSDSFLLSSSSSSSSEISSLSIPGLRNVGNNCFLNAVLQALASCGVLLTYLDNERKISASHGVGKHCPDRPLTDALSDLLSELSVIECQRRVASPCRVMCALEPYAKQFDLAIQQDAAEALTHITGALHEEKSTFLRSCKASEISTDQGSIDGLHMQGNGRDKEVNALQTCWPMEGTIGSMLTCQECGFQFPTQFQSFHDVPLSPPLVSGGNIAQECELEACLEQFTAPECITNVKCSYCSHVFALRLLHQKEKVNTDLFYRIQECTFGDDCHCESSVRKEGETWKNVYVNALKQLRFDRAPEVICCHMQRVVVSNSGELTKWKGRVKFPLVLDFFPYTLSAQGYTEQNYLSLASTPFHWMDHEELLHKYVWHKLPRGTAHLHREEPLSTSDESTSDDTHASSSSSDSEDSASEMSFESMVWRCENTVQDKYEEAAYRCDTPFSLPSNCLQEDNGGVLFGPKDESINEESKMLSSRGYQSDEDFIMENDTHDAAPISLMDALAESIDCEQVEEEDESKNKKWSYELVSVVVHDGSPGNGHYIVYRKAKLRKMKKILEEDSAEQCLSDVGDMEVEPMEVVDAIALGSADQADIMVSDNSYCGNGGISVCGGEACSQYDQGSTDPAIHASPPPSSASSLGLDEGYNLRSVGSLTAPMGSAQDSAQMEKSGQDSAEKEALQGCAPGDESLTLWFRISDSQVDLVREENVIMAEATLLFYERCPQQGKASDRV